MWYYLIASLFYLMVMFITFNDAFRKSSWYFPLSIFGNLIGSICWFLLVRHLNNNDKILIHSVYWDFMILVIGYLLPLLAFEFSFNSWQIFGMSLVIIGLCVIKAFHA